MDIRIEQDALPGLRAEQGRAGQERAEVRPKVEAKMLCAESK